MGKGEHYMTRDEFIKYKIKEKGFTLKDYAKFIGMPYSSLLSMLSGNLGGASLETSSRSATAWVSAFPACKRGTAFPKTYPGS